MGLWTDIKDDLWLHNNPRRWVEATVNWTIKQFRPLIDEMLNQAPTEEIRQALEAFLDSFIRDVVMGTKSLDDLMEELEQRLDNLKVDIDDLNQECDETDEIFEQAMNGTDPWGNPVVDVKFEVIDGGA